MKFNNYESINNEKLVLVNGGKYYGNGVYCGKHTCRVDWGVAIGKIGNNAAANLTTGGNAGWNN